MLYHQSRLFSDDSSAVSLSDNDVYICGLNEPDNVETLDDLRKLFREYSLIAKTSCTRFDASNRRIAIQNSDVFLLFLSKRSDSTVHIRSGSTDASAETCTLASREVQTELREAFLHKMPIMLMRDTKEHFSDEDLTAEGQVKIHVDPETNEKLLTDHQLEWVLALQPVVRERKNYETCLDRPYVQLEIRWALKYKKPIITVYERDPTRNGFFDYGKAANKYNVPCNCGVAQGKAGQEPIHKRGCQREWKFLLDVDSIQYQRDFFQVEAMLKNIYEKEKNELAHRKYETEVAPCDSLLNDPGKWDFFLSHHQKNGGDQVQVLHSQFGNPLYKDLPKKTAWYDQVMVDKSEPAMHQGVQHCGCFLLFLTADAAEKQADAMMKKVSRAVKEARGEEVEEEDRVSDEHEPEPEPETQGSERRPYAQVYSPLDEMQHGSLSLSRTQSTLRVSKASTDSLGEFLTPSDTTLGDDELRKRTSKETTSSFVGETDPNTPRPGAEGDVNEATARKMRDDLISLLQGLGETTDREYAGRQGSHWGAEDRSTKMWFITLTRRRLYLIIAAVVLQVVLACVKSYSILIDSDDDL
jgi:hypothetical protein